MEVRAYLKGARLSPQKACLVADMVRGLDVEKALDILSFSKQKGAKLIKKLLMLSLTLLKLSLSEMTLLKFLKHV